MAVVVIDFEGIEKGVRVGRGLGRVFGVVTGCWEELRRADWEFVWLGL